VSGPDDDGATISADYAPNGCGSIVRTRREPNGSLIVTGIDEWAPLPDGWQKLRATRFAATKP